MPFKIFRILFSKLTTAALHTTKNNSVILDTYNQLSIEQLCVCTVWLSQNDIDAKCRFFVVPGDKLALLGMPDIELLNILKVTHEVMGNPKESRKFDL